MKWPTALPASCAAVTTDAMSDIHDTDAGIETPRRAGRPFLILMGLIFIGSMTFPFACSETGGCRLGIVTPWSAFGWSAKTGVAMFVLTGITLLLQGLGLNTVARIVGMGLLPLFAAMANSILFGLVAPACGPVVGIMRAMAEVPVYPVCALWPTLTAIWIDTFFIGFTLEILRKEFLPEAPGQHLKSWTQGMLLFSLSPLLLLMLALLLPTIGGEVLKERWRRWRNS